MKKEVSVLSASSFRPSSIYPPARSYLYTLKRPGGHRLIASPLSPHRAFPPAPNRLAPLLGAQQSGCIACAHPATTRCRLSTPHHTCRLSCSRPIAIHRSPQRRDSARPQQSRPTQPMRRPAPAHLSPAPQQGDLGGSAPCGAVHAEVNIASERSRRVALSRLTLCRCLGRAAAAPLLPIPRCRAISAVAHSAP
jgi:hypothetical protein